ncbi:two-component system, chemotaxis family, response regulator CheY [Roseivivax lentus]|uniref:Two-component system, chemotaxis family, response regulator CheY n=1 Tax=Roseivivax lentus TaxID=633194 RepID=A0A1N7MR76_9RHOB|nr:response regulator [Roseivivax lentus]SIS88634.1 two-component system, chemotaxis family, response regulator CheY [Roseivivax lentus]
MALRDKLSVLVVDDMSTSRGLILMALDEIGIKNVDFCGDGRAALAKLSAQPRHLVISDYNMPEVNGLQLLHALRSAERTAKIGFILISGRLDNEIVTKGRQLGLNNVLQKPFDTAQMKACLQSVVGPL